MKANKNNLSYKGVPIFFDCLCSIPKPTKEVNELYMCTKCECDGWINDCDLIIEYAEFTEINETSS